MQRHRAIPQTTVPRVLMCRPKHFDVLYEINVFMEGNVRQVDAGLAIRQWDTLVNAIEEAGAKVELLEAQPGLPDLVFTANAGLVWGDQVVLSRFAHKERQGEEPFYREWFCRNGYATREVSDKDGFEGEGDVVVRGSFLYMGSHSRTSVGSAGVVERVTGREVVPVRLNPRRFYHIDTCMVAASPNGPLLYYPGAFTAEDREIIAAREGNALIPVAEEEAIHFACNTLIVGDTAISPTAPPSYAKKLQSIGLRSVMVDLGEFMKAGGAAKCLALKLNANDQAR